MRGDQARPRSRLARFMSEIALYFTHNSEKAITETQTSLDIGHSDPVL